jgi:hypothetical protein
MSLQASIQQTAMKKKPATWADVKISLGRMDHIGLVGVIRDLSEAGDLNRRFLHARFVAAAPVREEYRRLVRAAVFPDPFRHLCEQELSIGEFPEPEEHPR